MSRSRIGIVGSRLPVEKAPSAHIRSSAVLFLGPIARKHMDTAGAVLRASKLSTGHAYVLALGSGAHAISGSTLGRNSCGSSDPLLAGHVDLLARFDLE